MEDVFQGHTSWSDSLLLEIEVQQAMRFGPGCQIKNSWKHH